MAHPHGSPSHDQRRVLTRIRHFSRDNPAMTGTRNSVLVVVRGSVTAGVTTGTVPAADIVGVSKTPYAPATRSPVDCGT
jgi:hypothetical protein